MVGKQEFDHPWSQQVCHMTTVSLILTIYSEVLYEDLDDTEKYSQQLCPKTPNNKYKLPQ